MEGALPKEKEKERKEGAPPKEKERKEKEGAPPKEKERKEGVLPKEKEKERREKAKERAKEVEHTFQEIATNADFPDIEQLTAGMQVPWKLVQSWRVKLMMIALGTRTAGIRRTGPKTMVRRTGQTRRTGHGTTAGLPAGMIMKAGTGKMKSRGTKQLGPSSQAPLRSQKL